MLNICELSVAGKPLPVPQLIPRNAFKVPKAGAGAGAGCPAAAPGGGQSPGSAWGFPRCCAVPQGSPGSDLPGRLRGTGWLWIGAAWPPLTQPPPSRRSRAGPCSIHHVRASRRQASTGVPRRQQPACNAGGRKTTGQGQIQQGEEAELGSQVCKASGEPWGGGCSQLRAARPSGWRGGDFQRETLPGTDALQLQNMERRLDFSLRLNTSSPPGALGEEGHAKGKICG